MHDAPVSPRKLDKKVPRDLETIILKAIAKEPAHRYASAEQMAEDLRRFLADKPVLARRSSPTEQAWRWCRRNPALAATSALADRRAAGGRRRSGDQQRPDRPSEPGARHGPAREGRCTTVGPRERDPGEGRAQEAGSQRARAEAGEAQARAAVDEFLTRVTEDALLKAPGLQVLRRDLLRSALRFYDEFLKQRGDDPDLRAALADVQLRSARSSRTSGDGAGGQKSFLAARSIYQALRQEKPDDREVQAGLAECQFRLDAIPEAIDIYEKLIKLDPDEPSVPPRPGRGVQLASHLADRIAPRSRRSWSCTARRWPSARAWSASSPMIPRPGTTWAGRSTTSASCSTTKAITQDALAMYLRAVEQGEAAFARAPQVILYGHLPGDAISQRGADAPVPGPAR